MKDADYERAAAIVASCGLSHRKSGECLWAWAEESTHQHDGRYIDVKGLLDSDDPSAYVCDCGKWLR